MGPIVLDRSFDKFFTPSLQIVKSPFSEDGEMKQYHHPECLFDAFKRARATTKAHSNLNLAPC